MRAWRTLICLTLLLSGCLSGKPGRTAAIGQHPVAAVSVPVPTSEEFSRALARFAHGLLAENEEGETSENALEAYRKALSLNPDNHELASRIAFLSLKREDPQAAIDVLKASYDFAPDEYRRTVDLAVLFQTTGQFDQSVIFYRRALAIDQTPTAVYIALGGILFHQEKDHEALNIVETGHTLADEPHLMGIYLYEQARLFVSQGRFERAIPCFELLYTWDVVKTPDIQLLMAELYTAADRVDDAVRILKEAAGEAEASPDVLTALAIAAINADDIALATQTLASAASKFSDSPDALFMIGIVYAGMQRHDFTIEILENAMRLLSENISEEDILPPELSEPFYLYLGAAYERTRRFDDAERIFQTGLSVHPDSHRIMNYLAYMWAKENRELDAALKLSIRALILEPDNGAYTDTLGWIYYRLQQYELALETLTKARELTGDDPEILLHIGDVMDALDRLDEAVIFWRKSAEVDPSDANRSVIRLRSHEQQLSHD